MRKRILKPVMLTAVLFLSIASAGLAKDKDDKNVSEAAQQSKKAATVLQEIMATPDKAIPNNLLSGAHCVAVYPSVIKAGLVVGGRYGRGVVSCRTANGRWSSPLFVSLRGGSFGAQIGAEAIDYVLLGMNPSTAQAFTKEKFELGGEASAAAGPLGRDASASTDLPTIKSQFLSYSRSRGLFAGLELKGSVLKLDDDLNRAVYGRNYSPADILKSSSTKSPASLHAFTDALAKYAPAKNVTARK